jgi:glycogen debranching enzyme
MIRYRREDAAIRVLSGLLDALEAFGGRLPELFCGFDRRDKPVPVPYPTSCSPQAWSAATPFELLRIALALDADERGALVTVAPVPAMIGQVQIRGLPLGSGRVDVEADQHHARVIRN